jgi:hypothetical protein
MAVRKRDVDKEKAMWDRWHGTLTMPGSSAASQEGITGDGAVKQKGKKAKAEPPPKRDPLSWEESLENFLSSSCFVTYLCKAVEDDYSILQLHPYRLPCGYFWIVGPSFDETAKQYETIELQMPKLPDILYKIIMKKCQNSCWIAGPVYKNRPELESYKQALRDQLQSILKQKIA